MTARFSLLLGIRAVTDRAYSLNGCASRAIDLWHVLLTGLRLRPTKHNSLPQAFYRILVVWPTTLMFLIEVQLKGSGNSDLQTSRIPCRK